MAAPAPTPAALALAEQQWAQRKEKWRADRLWWGVALHLALQQPHDQGYGLVTVPAAPAPPVGPTQTEVDDVREDLADVQARLDDLEAAQTSLGEEHTTIEERVEDLSTRHAVPEVFHEDWADVHEELHADVRKMRADVEGLREDEDQTADRVEDIAEDVEDIGGSMGNIRTEVTELGKDHDTTKRWMKHLTQDTYVLRGDVEHIKTDAGDLNERQRTAEREVDVLSQTAREIYDDELYLRGRVDDLQKKNETTAQHVAKQDLTIAALQEKVEEATALRDELEAVKENVDKFADLLKDEDALIKDTLGVVKELDRKEGVHTRSMDKMQASVENDMGFFRERVQALNEAWRENRQKVIVDRKILAAEIGDKIEELEGRYTSTETQIKKWEGLLEQRLLQSMQARWKATREDWDAAHTYEKELIEGFKHDMTTDLNMQQKETEYVTRQLDTLTRDLRELRAAHTEATAIPGQARYREAVAPEIPVEYDPAVAVTAMRERLAQADGPTRELLVRNMARHRVWPRKQIVPAGVELALQKEAARYLQS